MKGLKKFFSKLVCVVVVFSAVGGSERAWGAQTYVSFLEAQSSVIEYIVSNNYSTSVIPAVSQALLATFNNSTSSSIPLNQFLSFMDMLPSLLGVIVSGGSVSPTDNPDPPSVPNFNKQTPINLAN